jgi:hypothetical protein
LVIKLLSAQAFGTDRQTDRPTDRQSDSYIAPTIL